MENNNKFTLDGITYGKYFYPFYHDDYYKIFYELLGEDWESYSFKDDREIITSKLFNNLPEYLGMIYPELEYIDFNEDNIDLESFSKGWDEFYDYILSL